MSNYPTDWAKLRELASKIHRPFLIHVKPPAARYQAVMVRQGTAALEDAGLYVVPVLLPGDQRYLYVSPLPVSASEAIKAAYHGTVDVHRCYGMQSAAERDYLLSQYVH